jgi:hypothetical protein
MMHSATQMQILAALVSAVLAPTIAHAQCTVTAQGDAASIAQAQSLAAHSDSPEVRAAWASHHCNVRKLLHGGGHACRAGIPLDHVTIRVFGTATFHVFPVKLGDGLYCTTE